MKTQTKKLREMLDSGKLIMAPGAYDAWSAKIIELAGFDAVYLTGYGVSASMIAKPDIGLLTFTEITTMAKNMVQAIDIPLIADCDTGFGTELNVIRCIREYEAAGVAAIQLEDQVTPKRCGHMEGKVLIPKDEMVAKLRAALYARKDPDFVIIARTDARAVNGIKGAIERGKAYIEAGADVIFLEAPRSVEEIKMAADCLSVPLLANMVENGQTPLLTKNELQKMGYRIAIYPVTAIYTATKAIVDNLESLKQTGTIETGMKNCVDFPTFNEMIGLHKERELELSFVRDK